MIFKRRELGVSNKSPHEWIKPFGEPLNIEEASDKELAARVRQVEKQLAVREAQKR